MAMLLELSTSTATTFCCGRSVATLSAGCQSRNSSSATMPVSSSQIPIGRMPDKHAVIAVDVPEEQTGGGQNGQRHQPQRPRRKEDELASDETGWPDI